MKKSLLALIFFVFAASAFGAEQEVQIQTPMGPVYGTLLTPDKSSETVVLLIAGSGPTDRNGNNPLGVNAASYYLIASELQKSGVASLRYDKRGIAASSSPQATNATLRFGDYIDDASAWIDFLSGQGYRKIVLLGHSEGSQIAFEAAARNPKATAVISLCGAGESAANTLRRQLGAQLPLALSVKANIIIDGLVAGRRADVVPTELYALFNPDIQDYLISWLSRDPATVLAGLTVPVLIISGATDIQISADDASKLAAARRDARSVRIEGMNHVLKECASTDMNDQMATYVSASMPLHPSLMPTIEAFIAGL